MNIPLLSKHHLPLSSPGNADVCPSITRTPIARWRALVCDERPCEHPNKLSSDFSPSSSCHGLMGNTQPTKSSDSTLASSYHGNVEKRDQDSRPFACEAKHPPFRRLEPPPHIHLPQARQALAGAMACASSAHPLPAQLASECIAHNKRKKKLHRICNE